jgi:tryptophan synthase beta chain
VTGVRNQQHKVLLDESQMPTQWYNVVPDLPSPPPPPLHPGTLQPVGPDDLAPLFPMDLIAQEVTTERYVDIPGEVLDVYKLWRPSPLYRAHRLEQALGTPARIYYKYEGVSPAGSHKPNTAVPQAYYNAKAGVRKLTTETGAGQWGTALAFAAALFGLECEVWQVGASYDQKPYRRIMMETYGATVHRSPSDLTTAGRAIRADNPDHPGSLGIAISEAVEVAAADPETRYALGSVLNHVLLHQTVIGEEALLQLAQVGETPDLLVGCTGGGSNFGGLMFPFLRERWAGRMSPTIRAVEPTACPSLTQGTYAYDFGDTAGTTPLMKMHTLGHDFVPDPIHAGGLRYHGMSPLVSHLYETGEMEAIAKPQSECFAAGVLFARTEGILPAPEPTHALAAAIEEARRCAETGEEKVILTALCGHGHLDLPAYASYLAGSVTDHEWGDSDTQAALQASLARLPQLS